MIESIIKLFGGTPVEDIAMWRSWWTTKMSTLAASLQAAGLYFAVFPPHWTQAFPVNLGAGMVIVGTILTVIIPFVRGTQQPKLAEQRAINQMLGDSPPKE